jgi:plasmid stabilization system protein ParE
MPETPFRIEFSPEAEADLYQILDYWSARGEAWRGEKHHRDLTNRAEAELSLPSQARRGRRIKSLGFRSAQEVLAFGVYRIIYRIDESRGIVEVLRFWHTHRDEPPDDA